MLTFRQLQKNLKKDFGGFTKIKIALLGDSATQFLSQAIRGSGFESGLDCQIWEADFNQIERQVFDASADLYRFAPDVVIVFYASHKLLGKYNRLKPEEQSHFADRQLELVDHITTSINAGLKTRIVWYNYTEIDDAVFGNFASKINTSFLFQLRKLNYELMLYASRQSNFFICDISSIQNRVGKDRFFQPSVYINTEMVLSLDILPEFAAITVQLIASLFGKIKKCLVLDLDNTLWGGVIGDDGIENIELGNLGIGKAFTEFQYWIKKLQQRGIILCVCSKNTEPVAKEPFEKHPDMVLRLQDIAVFIANWESKVDNIRQIQSILNIGFDSMVFLDDNPFERNIVKENIPGITVPDLPEDPADFLEFLYSLQLFETSSFSNADAERTQLYQVEARRIELQKNSTNEDEFLQTLDMVSAAAPFNQFNTPRVAQLSQRSNQFNLRTVRYTEADIQALATDADTFTFAFSLEDKFGDNGLVGLIILRKETAGILFIDTWLMSCRVLKRGMENFMLNTIVQTAKENDCNFLKGAYIPTAKNDMVKAHYKNLGFEPAEDYWLLDVSAYVNRNCFIKPKENDGKK